MKSSKYSVRRPKKFKIGDYVLVKQDLAPIPKGIYKISSKDELMYYFTIGKDAFVGISHSAEKYFEKVDSRLGRKKRIRKEDFMNKYNYFISLENMGNDQEYKDIFSFCAVPEANIEFAH